MKLPKGWKICDAVSLCNLITKGTTPRNTVSRETQGNIPFLRVQNLSFNGKLDFSSGLLFVAGDTNSSELARSRLYPGDVLTNIVGPPLGKVSVVTNEYPEWNMNQAIAVFRTNESCVSRFLSYYLQSQAAKNWLSSQSKKTSGQQNLTLETCNSLPVPLPPLTEQHKIAEILSTWDEALEKFDALIAAKERRKKGLMQRLLTGKRRVKGFKSRWATFKLGKLFSERVEQNRDDLPLLAITADRGVVPRDVLSKRDTSSEDKSKYLRIAPGDIGYNTMRMWQGVSAMSALEGIISPAYTVCVPSEKIDGRFAAHFFKLPHTVHLFHRYSQGLVDDTLNLKYLNFATIEVYVPLDVAEQRAIADILDACDEELRLLRGQQAAIERQKRGLMQRVLTGKTRVTTSGEYHHA